MYMYIYIYKCIIYLYMFCSILCWNIRSVRLDFHKASLIHRYLPKSAFSKFFPTVNESG